MSKSITSNLEFMLKLYNSISAHTKFNLTSSDIEHIQNEIFNNPSTMDLQIMTKTLSQSVIKNRNSAKDAIKNIITNTRFDAHEFTKEQLIDDEFKNSVDFQQITAAEQFANEPFLVSQNKVMTTIYANNDVQFNTELYPQSTNQFNTESTNQSTNQFNTESTNQSTNQFNTESTNQFNTESTNQSTNQFNTESTNQSTNQFNTESTNQSTNQRDICVSRFLNIETIKDLQLAFNPQVQYKSRFFVLDSNNYDTYDAQGKITWQLVPSRNLQNGVCNITKPLENIIGMKLHQFKTTFTTTFLRRWTLFIEQLSAQSMIGPNGKKFHFIFTVKVNDNTALVHNFNQGQYWFHTPITQLSTITLTLGNPYTTIPINLATQLLVGIEFFYI